MAIHGPCYYTLLWIQRPQPARKQRTTISIRLDLYMTHSPLFFVGLSVRQGYSVPCVPELDDLTVGGLLDFALCPDEFIFNSYSRSHSHEWHDIYNWHHNNIIYNGVFLFFLLFGGKMWVHQGYWWAVALNLPRGSMACSMKFEPRLSSGPKNGCFLARPWRGSPVFCEVE